ncbi:MAG: thioredoxin domain-containing protein [Acidobacteria bacterium]|nr:thioredoxin domain-containing protein [Acidobacteriota bacterium]
MPNALAQASSSYLRSAMHQPIAWQEWGEAAFAAAQRENKPILLDVGAVWCHWCHVMDRESYDDPDVAHIVNQNFIAVKVDRDERPDVDSRYQAAISAISGQGGWPLTAFLTPQGKPFYGGTYFPPQDHWGRPGFKRVLLSIAQAFREKQGDVAEQARMVESATSQAEDSAGRAGSFTPNIIESIVNAAMGMFDAQNGGFGSAPKFFHSAVLDLIIDRYVRTGSERWRNAFVTTLEKMARGGVYDQLAGGFHRYSVDERWIVPHFEKMAYDNSELLKNYLHAYQATELQSFADVARDIIRWMDEWLSDRERGGFYASQDADCSMDDDGDYFTWTPEEAKRVLSEEEARVACLRYDINEVGEMPHNPAKNVLYVRASEEEIGARLNLTRERVLALLASAQAKMYAARRGRATPYVDKTVYVSWNALCISAYLEAARVLNLLEARRFALRSLDRILGEGWDRELGLKHVISYSELLGENSKVRGLLDDYAFMVLACLDAYETTADLTYFNFARQIADLMIARFFDHVSGGFFDTPREGEDQLGILGARRKPFQDSPTPAGNSVAVIGLLRLYSYTNAPEYWAKAQQTLEAFAGVAEQYGIFAATYAIASVYFSQPHTQVLIVGTGDRADCLCAAAVAQFALNKTVVCLTENELAAKNLPPALAQTIPHLNRGQDGNPVAVICTGFSCQPAESDAKQLATRLRQQLKAA